MALYLVCKHCDSELELVRGAAMSCPGCGAEAAESTALFDAIDALASEMARVRTEFRFEVLLETDDLPEPHGFDADYILPEDHAKLAEGTPAPPRACDPS